MKKRKYGLKQYLKTPLSLFRNIIRVASLARRETLFRITFWAGLLGVFALPLSAEDLVCGITTGFPPYQYEQQGSPSGFDADLIRLAASKANLNLKFKTGRWDDLINYLRLGQISCITGMEVTPPRKELFDFTISYYERVNAVFIRAEDVWIKGVEDLYYQRITGDRQSDMETQWTVEGIRGNIRIQQTETKQEAMRLLADRHSLAALMPREVGFYLADIQGLEVRILLEQPTGTPVALAVRQGDRELLEKLNTALEELVREGAIERLNKIWFSRGE